ncbi:Embryo sac development arrest [Salix suchowensis]|nr:Embryo sac development arrest [Salix suchowensis]
MDRQHLDGDEAKHWLPSYMFLREAIPSNSHYLPSKMDLHFPTSLQNKPAGSLYRPPPPKATPCSQCISPVVPDVSVNNLLPGYHDLGLDRGVEVGQRLYGNGTGRLCTRFDPVYSLQVKQRVDDFYLETRTRVLQKQQNRLLENRIYPFQGNVLGLGGGGGGGGLMKESGGTGVFHPRIVNPPREPVLKYLKRSKLLDREIGKSPSSFDSQMTGASRRITIISSPRDGSASGLVLLS